jgi:hypothetical protein
MSGLCGGDSYADEKVQWQALNASVRDLLPCGTTQDPKWYEAIQECRSLLDFWLHEIKNLGGFAADGRTTFDTTYDHKFGASYGSVRLGLEIKSGSAHVTSLVFKNFGLDLTHLTRLVQGLPSLKVLGISHCVNYGPSMGVSVAQGANARKVPSLLPSVAPKLSTFHVKCSHVSGTLPSSFGRWTQMTSISFYDNYLTGSIPQVRRRLTYIIHSSIRLCHVPCLRQNVLSYISRRIRRTIYLMSSCVVLTAFAAMMSWRS